MMGRDLNPMNQVIAVIVAIGYAAWFLEQSNAGRSISGISRRRLSK